MTPPPATTNIPLSTGFVVIGVGSAVRAPRRRRRTSSTTTGGDGDGDGGASATAGTSTKTTKTTPTGRATVATISSPPGAGDRPAGADAGAGADADADADVATAKFAGLASLLWDDTAPRPLVGDGFVVTPLFDDDDDGREDDDDCDDEEDDVPISDLSPLLPFEVSTDASASASAKDDAAATDDAADYDDEDEDERSPALRFKEGGDALYRLGDPSAAAERYEATLAILRSTGGGVRIGGVVVINAGGHPTLADVDCVEEDDGDDDGDDALDVTYVDAGGKEVERTVRRGEVLLVVHPKPEGRLLQERTLLNLSRCMLLLADVDGERRPGRRTEYLRGAILGSSLALTLTCSRDGDDECDADAAPSSGNNTEVKARTLRARAYIELGRFRHASSDLRRILSHDPCHGEAKSLVVEVRRREARKRQADRRLAKDVCGWVQRATAGDGEGGDGKGGSPSTTVSDTRDGSPRPQREDAVTSPMINTSSSSPLSPSLALSLITAAAVVAALVLPLLLGGGSGMHGPKEGEL